MAVAPGTTKYARRKTPKAAARRTVEDVPSSDFDDDESPESRVKAQLADLMNERIREAVNARESSGIEEEWRDAEDLYQGTDELNVADTRMRGRDKNSGSKRAKIDGGQSTLLLNITKPKTKIAVSRVKEMLVPTSEKPWDISPTPIPEFDDITTKPELAGQNVTLADGTQAPALAVVEIAREKSQAAIDGEEAWIEDRFVEGRVYAEMRAVIEDAGRLGTGVLKGPFPQCKKTREWRVNGSFAELKMKERYEPTSKRVRIQDIYPDPGCGQNVHNGSYLCERDFVNAKTLRELAKDPSYNAAAIADAILEGPMPGAKAMQMGTKERKKPGDASAEGKLFELWYVYGDVPPEHLIAMGVTDAMLDNLSDRTKAANDPVDEADTLAEAEAAFDPTRERAPLTAEQEAALAQVPAMVTMLNGVPIKAVVQPLESGEFPFDLFPWEVVEGQPWGKGVPIAMRAAQIIVKAGVRRLLENGGLASGPQIVITEGAIQPVDDRYEINGRKLWKFIPTELINDVRMAMAMFEIPSMQAELLGIVNFGLEMADRLTNIPMLLQGDQTAGTSPETLGGMKLLVQNSMAPLRDIAKQYDDYLVVPHLGRYHEWFMLNVPDKPKGDADIKALGSTALVQREEGREFLMMLGPVKDDPAYRIDPAKYSKELARSNGYDMGLIQYSEEDWKKAPNNPANAQPVADPAIEVAKLRAASAEKIAVGKMTQDEKIKMTAENARAVHEENDRALRVQELALKERIAMIEDATKRGVSIEQVKAELAQTAAELQSRRTEMQLKLMPENASHLGI